MNNWRKYLGLLRSKVLYYRSPHQARQLVNFYSEFIGDGDLCFDIGAHLGNRSNAWLKLGARVIAVEPQPQCVSFLRKKFKGNAKLEVLQNAIADKAGTTTLHLSSLTPTISTLSDGDWRETMAGKTSFKVEWDEKLEVESITLDQMIDQYGLPKFCKIDVEGFELKVLQGLSTPIPFLSFEYLSDTAGHDAVRCVEVLSALGNYEYNWSYAESLHIASHEWHGLDHTRSFLASLKPSDPSGDLYARLKVYKNFEIDVDAYFPP